MIRKAVGMLIRSTAVAATTNRTSHRLVARKSTIPLPKRMTTRSSPIPSTRRIGTSVKIILPARVSRPHVRAAAVIGTESPFQRRPLSSLVNPAHDRIEGGHDGHRVGDQVAGREQADRLEVDERRI